MGQLGKTSRTLGEAGHELLVQLFATFCVPLAPALADRFIGQAFRLSIGQRCLFYQQALSFVSLSGATPFEHHRVPPGMFLRATS